MAQQLNRRDLIRGRLARPPILPRPPDAIAEKDFRFLCNRCHDCEKSCNTGLIGRDGDGFPSLRFGHAKCTFCGACAEACKTGALNAKAARDWTISAGIDSSCLSSNGITCRACEEACEAGAIRFRLMTGGRAQALVNTDRCTGCGNCAAVCPNKSIAMTSQKKQEMVA